MDVIVIDRKTLEGLIDQIFDKALIETGFCEMYAQVRAAREQAVREGIKRNDREG